MRRFLVTLVVAVSILPLVMSCGHPPPTELLQAYKSPANPAGNVHSAAPPTSPGNTPTAADEPVDEGFPVYDVPVLTANGCVAVRIPSHPADAGWMSDGRAWLWGDISPQDGRFLAAISLDGIVKAYRIPPARAAGAVIALSLTGRSEGEARSDAWLGLAWPPGSAWCLSCDDTWVDLDFFREAMPSPSRKWVLYDRGKEAVLYDTSDWTATILEGVSALYWGDLKTAYWLGDNRLVTQVWPESPEPGGLRFVAVPEGEVLAEMAAPGAYLSPSPSPSGRWVAVLRCSEGPEEIVRNLAGDSLTILETTRLPSVDPAAVVWPRPGDLGAMMLATEPVWSPDSSRMAFAVGFRAGPGLSEQIVMVAEAPAFVPVAIPCGGDGPGAEAGVSGWLPMSFSPDNRYLLLTIGGGPVAAVWDFSRNTWVTLPAATYGGWVRSDRIANGYCLMGHRYASESPAKGEWPISVIVDPATGVLSRLGLAGGQSRITVFSVISPDGSLVSCYASVGDDGMLGGPFGKVDPGQWFIIMPALAMTAVGG